MSVSDISNFIESYCASFRPGSAAAAVENFDFPVTILADGEKLNFARPDELEAMFGKGLAALSEKGFSHSTVDDSHIQLLGDSAALVSAAFTRWHKDGSVLEEIAATYTVFCGVENVWKITTLIIHDVEALITR